MKLLFLLSICASVMCCQTVQNVGSFKPKDGFVWDFSVIKNDSDGKIYTLISFAESGTWFIGLFTEGFKEISRVNASQYANVSSRFIFEDKLYFLNESVKYFSLTDFRVHEFKTSRHNITRLYHGKFLDNEIVITGNNTALYIYDLNTQKELFNLPFISPEKNLFKTCAAYNSVFYTQAANELVKFDMQTNKVEWVKKIPDKPVKLLGISISSIINAITVMVPNTYQNKETISVFTMAGDYYRFDAATGRLLANDKEYDVFTDIKQNNSRLFAYTRFFDDKKGKRQIIYAGSIDHYVYAFVEGTFDEIWKTDAGNEVSQPIALFDITKDTYPELFFVTDYDNKLFILNGLTGKKMHEFSVKGGEKFNQTKVLLGDFTGAGVLQMMIKVNTEALKILELSPEIPVSRFYLPKAG